MFLTKKGLSLTCQTLNNIIMQKVSIFITYTTLGKLPSCLTTMKAWFFIWCGFLFVRYGL